MYYSTTRKLVNSMIVSGIVLIIYGLLQYLTSHDLSSEELVSVFTIKRLVFPILGIIITSIGYTLLKLISEIEDQALSVREELIQLRKLVQNGLNDKH
ncbi:hypothetical protein [Paenibacillus sp. OV219]|uniref:hypothetical protein n=1 Tax=Paenibacillus sp. OV219 TaxID=1884377 RepID=UPI0008D03741|nr:hypothetical protein [Paenibacillus sp. OV219]SEO94751.1 hypothetical protein SAMN05518847_11364 [Paenibacillus sp. OV219]